MGGIPFMVYPPIYLPRRTVSFLSLSRKSIVHTKSDNIHLSTISQQLEGVLQDQLLFTIWKWDEFQHQLKLHTCEYVSCRVHTTATITTTTYADFESYRSTCLPGWLSPSLNLHFLLSFSPCTGYTHTEMRLWTSLGYRNGFLGKGVHTYVTNLVFNTKSRTSRHVQHSHCIRFLLTKK